MTMPTVKLYPSAPPEKDGPKQRLERILKDVNSFDNSINNVKEMSTSKTKTINQEIILQN